ncbi:MAG: MFS transporter [Thermomicrobiales bacterium]
MRSILTNRSFILLWWAGLFAQLTWWMLHTAMLVLVFERTGSAFGTGLIPVFSAIPTIVFGAVAGRIVDTFDRRRVMRWGADALIALLLIALPFGGSHATPVIGLYLFIAVQSAIMTVMAPAENALLPTLVESEHLKTANALNVLNDGVGRIVGPAIGAPLLVAFGPTALVTVSLGLTGVAWGLLTAMPASGVPMRYNDLRHDDWSWRQPGIVASLREQGALVQRIIVAGGPLAVIVAAFTLYMVADVPFSAIFPAFFTDSLHASTEEFGFMLSLRGVAGILGGLLIVAVARRIPAPTLLAGGLLAYGFAIGIQGIIDDFWIGLWFLILVGPAAAAIQTGMNTLLQESSPDRERGRIFALTGTLGAVVAIVMSPAAGAIAAGIGTRPIVVASGLLQILPAILVVRRFSCKKAVPKLA